MFFLCCIGLSFCFKGKIVRGAMANRVKEDEKNEKIIRGLLKLPANRRCINCNNLGPQYVCTNFWTFICTNCSGIHREFTHRVKSISMAKFTSQEVTALQEGGNERAREIYFKDWDPQRHSFPDSSNIDRLRDFIKHVYVDRRYSGGRHGDRPQMLKGDKDVYNENRRAEPYRGGSRSPPYEDRYSPSYGGRNDDRSFRYNYGERSPAYNQGDYKRSPARFEVLDDRQRDDKFGNGSQNRKTEDRRLPDAPKPEGRSPDHQKDFNKMSPPVVRPVRDILGDNAPQLQVGGAAKTNGIRGPDDSAKIKSTLSSNSIDSTDANSAQLKGSFSESLIDFDVDHEPPVAAITEQPVAQQTTSGSDGGADWAAFDTSGQQKVPQVDANANPLVSALAQLSVSGSTPVGNLPTLSFSQIESSPKAGGGGNLLTMQQQQQQQPLVFPSIDNPPGNQSSNVSVVGTSNNQTWIPSPIPHGQGNFTNLAINPAGHLPRIATKLPQEKVAGVSSQPPSAESKTSGRKELPVDFFTSLYPSAPVTAQGWQRGPYPGMGYNIQYSSGVAMPTYSQTPKSVNPFDLTSDPAAVYPSVTPLQAALSNMTAPATLLRTSSFGAPSPHSVHLQQSPYASSVSPGPFMMHQVPDNMPQQFAASMMPMGNQGIVAPASNGATFSTSGIHQNPAVRYSQLSTPNSFGSVGGNPFG
ncbi:probable ADP-ribosylation factor GTPase-activating protein AGD14 isoform X1 [Musa acuminata AAA Group]|uniref:probable ADP-ribosylation factor GTPase-activating protein AGD14 isoform X1 n=2 Tax=Musa acuminata AAA Group TaxID=214697 RepID=UPI0031DC5681